MHTISMPGITFDEYLRRYEGVGPDAWYADLDIAKFRGEYREAIAALCAQFGELTGRGDDGELIAPPCVWAYASRRLSGADPAALGVQHHSARSRLT
jgi:hypothetical protein